MKPKKGQSFWSVYVDDGKIDWFEYVVTCIRRFRYGVVFDWSEKSAYMINKTPYTWVKKSKKHGDFGWATNIPRLYKTYMVIQGDGCIDKSRQREFSTKLAAILHAQKELKQERGTGFKSIEMYDGLIYTAEEQEDEYKKNMTALKRAATRERKKKGKEV